MKIFEINLIPRVVIIWVGKIPPKLKLCTQCLILRILEAGDISGWVIFLVRKIRSNRMIHKYKMFGTNVLVDVNSGAIHEVDDVTYDILDYFEDYNIDYIKDKLKDKYKSSEIEEAHYEIEQLKKEGTLFSEDLYQEYVPTWNKKHVVKALCLHISHDCNLRCKYCFAGTGNFGGERVNMSKEVGIAAIDFLVLNSGSRKNLEIDFFGGEPLINFDTVKAVVEYAKSIEKKYNKHFNFTITTNGLLLNDDILDYINKNMGNVVLSIDGRKETNDRMRCRVDGTGSYDTILPKFKKVAESRNQDKYYVRGTFTRENLDFCEDVIHLADEGFKQISVEPVVAAKGTGYDIRKEDLPYLFEEYEKLAKEYVERDKAGKWFNFFHFMIDLTQGPCIVKRLSGCGSGSEYLAITPEGDIYPCHQFVGMKDFNMGNVLEKTFDTSIQKEFGQCNVYTKNECRNCWAKFYCSGGCLANAHQFNGTINSVYDIGCELERKRVECAIWIKTQDKV